MYCLKCKTDTESHDLEERISSNNRKMLCAICQKCGRKKSQFVSVKSGQGVFNNVLSAVGNTLGEIHLPASQGEYVPNGSFNNQRNYSYCGPGTKYEQRNIEGYQGINELDRMCKLHDKFYNQNSDTYSRNISDEALAHRAYEIAHDSRYDATQRNMANIVYYIMKNKARFGLGINFKKLANEKTVVDGKLSSLPVQWTNQLADELHRPVIKKFRKRRVFVTGIDEIWSCDLVDMQSIAKSNDGMKYLLTVIDVFSKYAWVIPLRNKTGAAVAAAFAKIFKGARKPKKIWADKGKEFYNKNIKNLFAVESVELYSTENEEKSCIIERFNRTIRQIMFRYFTANSTRKYIDILDKLVTKYNNTRHSSIKMTPIDASLKKNEPTVFRNLYPISVNAREQTPKFVTGDRVRITAKKKLFAKGCTPNWTKEIFIVSQVLFTDPITYRITDFNKEEIQGSFYEHELQKSRLSDRLID